MSDLPPEAVFAIERADLLAATSSRMRAGNIADSLAESGYEIVPRAEHLRLVGLLVDASNGMRRLVTAYEHLRLDTSEDQELHDRLTATSRQLLDAIDHALGRKGGADPNTVPHAP